MERCSPSESSAVRVTCVPGSRMLSFASRIPALRANGGGRNLPKVYWLSCLVGLGSRS